MKVTLHRSLLTILALAALLLTTPVPGEAATTHRRAQLPKVETQTARVEAPPGPSTMAGKQDRDEHQVVFVNGFLPFDPLYDPFWDLGPAYAWWGPWYYGVVPYVGAAYPQGAPTGMVPVQLHVHPWTAALIVDGDNMGEARDYNGPEHPLWLKPGKHEVTLQQPGYRPLKFEIDLGKEQAYNLHYRLSKV
jgi:hypothetical protein